MALIENFLIIPEIPSGPKPSITLTSKKFGLFLWKFFDLKIIDGFGPDGISSMVKKFSVKANKFQSGYIYHYAFIMLLGFSALLTFLIVK